MKTLSLILFLLTTSLPAAETNSPYVNAHPLFHPLFHPLLLVTNTYIKINPGTNVACPGSLTVTNFPSFNTNVVNLLVESGEFCRIRGHVWLNRPWFGCSNSEEQRTCGVCGKIETKTPGEWK